jgi:hypothetical protein
MVGTPLLQKDNEKSFFIALIKKSSFTKNDVSRKTLSENLSRGKCYKNLLTIEAK